MLSLELKPFLVGRYGLGRVFCWSSVEGAHHNDTEGILTEKDITTKVQGCDFRCKHVRQPVSAFFYLPQLILFMLRGLRGKWLQLVPLFPERHLCACYLSEKHSERVNNLLPVFPRCFSDLCIHPVCLSYCLRALSPEPTEYPPRSNPSKPSDFENSRF